MKRLVAGLLGVVFAVASAPVAFGYWPECARARFSQGGEADPEMHARLVEWLRSPCFREFPGGVRMTKYLIGRFENDLCADSWWLNAVSLAKTELGFSYVEQKVWGDSRPRLQRRALDALRSAEHPGNLEVARKGLKRFEPESEPYFYSLLLAGEAMWLLRKVDNALVEILLDHSNGPRTDRNTRQARRELRRLVRNMLLDRSLVPFYDERPWNRATLDEPDPKDFWKHQPPIATIRGREGFVARGGPWPTICQGPCQKGYRQPTPGNWPPSHSALLARLFRPWGTFRHDCRSDFAPRP